MTTEQTALMLLDNQSRQRDLLERLGPKRDAIQVRLGYNAANGQAVGLANTGRAIGTSLDSGLIGFSISAIFTEDTGI